MLHFAETFPLIFNLIPLIWSAQEQFRCLHVAPLLLFSFMHLEHCFSSIFHNTSSCDRSLHTYSISRRQFTRPSCCQCLPSKLSFSVHFNGLIRWVLCWQQKLAGSTNISWSLPASWTWIDSHISSISLQNGIFVKIHEASLRDHCYQHL